MKSERKVNPLIQWWVAPHLPPEHIFVPEDRRPEGIDKLFRLYTRKWLVHPFRRHLTHVYSRFLAARGCDIIGVTGSAGKTTTKEMITSVLSQRYQTVKSKDNIDPVYNIPATVLSAGLSTQRFVLEMGIEFPGEMDFYLWMAQPRIGVVTNIDWTHTEFFGDVEGVFREKGRLIESLPEDGWAVLNADDKRVRRLAKKTKARVVWFGTAEEAGVRASGVTLVRNGREIRTRFLLEIDGETAEVNLALLGKHFVIDALAAAAVGYVSGVDLVRIKKGLEAVIAETRRMAPIFKADGSVILDDSYNANPLATEKAVETLVSIPGRGRRIVVLADMLELGGYEKQGHRAVGQFAVSQGVDMVFGFGQAARDFVKEAQENGLSKSRAQHFGDKDELIVALKKVIKPGDIVLVKGSRSMRMEEVVEAIT